ncbi:MAG: four helix bundle protein [Verrucomicrobiales bacterium]
MVKSQWDKGVSQFVMKTINDLEIYRQAMELGELVWSLVSRWNPLGKNTIGYQLVRSTDSIAANIVEGYGRYHYKENQKFCYYARGSLEETQTWIEKAVQRDLIAKEQGRDIYSELQILKKRLNAYIKSIGSAS